MSADTCSEWFCFLADNGLMMPVRVNAAGDVECMSYNAQDCLWPAATGMPCAEFLGNHAPDPGSLMPLECGAMHEAGWGSTGYDNPGYWCTEVRQVCPA